MRILSIFNCDEKKINVSVRTQKRTKAKKTYFMGFHLKLYLLLSAFACVQNRLLFIVVIENAQYWYFRNFKYNQHIIVAY